MANTLVIGAGGFIGGFIVTACLEIQLPTFFLHRSTSNPSSVKALKDKGAIAIEGSFADKELMEKKLREHKIEVVICVCGGENILDQLVLIEAMKSVGKSTNTIKRFLPSEFGHDIDKSNPVEPGLSFYKEKRMVRRAVEASGIPYTYICCNSIASWPYYDNIHPSKLTPPLDHFQIYADGSVGAYFVSGKDIGKITVRAAEDARTINKSIHFRPACNLFTMNKMASLWESKLGYKLPRITVSEHQLLALAAEKKIPQSIVAALTHDIFIKGCQTNFSIDGEKDVEACNLYPDIKFQTLDYIFDQYALHLNSSKPLIMINNKPQPQLLEAHLLNNKL
ncbi:hypothetical protein J5N97_016864 [Dioscorea zingiberensis]|uniref:NmrA-like domain-containing protein n=1 Tax=Dioscorea zingiberensis TaxID=325984 RepID=A0A9D5HFT3_9LILI|nr:hypothetical protein J5N97_016864 [Dioscorea zingiberensis]